MPITQVPVPQQCTRKSSIKKTSRSSNLPTSSSCNDDQLITNQKSSLRKSFRPSPLDGSIHELKNTFKSIMNKKTSMVGVSPDCPEKSSPRRVTSTDTADTIVMDSSKGSDSSSSNTIGDKKNEIYRSSSEEEEKKEGGGREQELKKPDSLRGTASGQTHHEFLDSLRRNATPRTARQKPSSQDTSSQTIEEKDSDKNRSHSEFLDSLRRNATPRTARQKPSSQDTSSQTIEEKDSDKNRSHSEFLDSLRRNATPRTARQKPSSQDTSSQTIEEKDSDKNRSHSEFLDSLRRNATPRTARQKPSSQDTSSQTIEEKDSDKNRSHSEFLDSLRRNATPRSARQKKPSSSQGTLQHKEDTFGSVGDLMPRGNSKRSNIEGKPVLNKGLLRMSLDRSLHEIKSLIRSTRNLDKADRTKDDIFDMSLGSSERARDFGRRSKTSLLSSSFAKKSRLSWGMASAHVSSLLGFDDSHTMRSSKSSSNPNAISDGLRKSKLGRKPKQALWRQKKETVGQPIACSLCIVDNALRPVQTGTTGEVCIAASTVIDEYIRDDESNKKSFFYLANMRWFR